MPTRYVDFILIISSDKTKIYEKNLYFKKIKDLKILIIGEIIFDKYTYVTTRGTSPKSSTLSSTIDYSELMPGGTLATYRFIKQFTKNVNLLSGLNSSLININKKIFTTETKKDLKFFNIPEKLSKDQKNLLKELEDSFD